MNTQIQSSGENGISPAATVADILVPALNATVLLALEVSDPEVVAELKKHSEGAPREAYALGALRLGVLSLRQAAGELDATAIREAGQKLLSSLAELLTKRGTEITTELTGALRQYFDPTTGALPQRIEALLSNDGELDRALRAHLAPENSTIARALAAHLGEGSQLFKLLSPTDASGLKAQISAMLESVLEEQQGQILREFSLDKPDSALSRLVTKVEAAQKAITNEFSTDNDQSAITRLSRMLQETRQQIDKNLTLDDETSALSRLKRELETTIEGLAKTNRDFQAEVRTTLATMQARREEAAKSTQHGHTFEDQLGLVLAVEAQRLNDLHEATGNKVGAIKNTKTGDFVTILGPESAAPGARIVWEAKDDKSYDLKSARAEMEEARKNRQAQVGVFVFARGAAPDGLQPFARYVNDLVITWDPDDPTSDLFIKVALSVARALVIRESHESVEAEQVVTAIELATRTIEKQLDHLEQIKTWAETVKNNGENIADRARRMRADLAKEIESLDRHVQALKTTGTPA
jgi:hypothetical protein